MLPLPNKFFGLGQVLLSIFFFNFPEIFYFLLSFAFFFKIAYGFLAKVDSLFFFISVFFLHFFCLFFFYSSLFAVTSLSDLFVVDYPGNPGGRFEANYMFLSHFQNIRFYLKFFISLYGLVPSVCIFFPSANWLERESWDFFGLRFLFHENLRRLLTDYGFKGHPLRKDFPLSGFLEVRFDDSFFAVLAEPLELAQKLRLFGYANVWNRETMAGFNFF